MKTLSTNKSRSLLELCTAAALLSLTVAAKGDALDNWTPCRVVTDPSAGIWFRNVAYGNGRFVAAGEYQGWDFGNIQTSDDATNWVSLGSVNMSVHNLADIIFANGLFVAGGWDYYSGHNLYHSTNGVDWTPHQTSIANFNSFAYGAGLFVAAGDGLLLNSSNYTNRNIYLSHDGITWTARSSGSPTEDSHPFSSVAYGPGQLNGWFVAVDSAHHIYTSSSGVTWSRQTNTLAGNAVGFCNDRFIIPVGPGTNLFSTDGVNWTAMTNSTSALFGRVIYADGYYVTLSGNRLFTSADATNWTQRAAQIPPNVTLSGITYGNRKFLAVGTAYPPSPGVPVAYVSEPTVGLAVNSNPPGSINLSGLVGRSYRIEQVDDLRSANWQPAATLILTNSPCTWTDPQPASSSRFYRAVLLP